MATKPVNLIALDVGEKRIGVARADSQIRLAHAYATVQVDGRELDEIKRIVTETSADVVVIGFPRNQQGEETAQTQSVKDFAKRLEYLPVKLVFQDESLTSVLAEQQLKALKKPYSKEDIDALAAALILNDYVNQAYATKF